MEAHGTGTKVGDPEELQTLDKVFCTGRERPLFIGSVKSNIGHNEPVSGICSIIKVSCLNTYHESIYKSILLFCSFFALNFGVFILSNSLYKAVNLG